MNDSTIAKVPDGFVRFQVNGKIYDLLLENLKKYESSLSNLVFHPIHNSSENKEIIFLDEDPSIFEAILHYHRSGLIVRPPAVAWELWQDRVKYWAFGTIRSLTGNKGHSTMLDFMLYFGKRFIQQYNPQEQTITWKTFKNPFILSVSAEKYDVALPFYMNKNKVNFIIGRGVYSIASIECTDTFDFTKEYEFTDFSNVWDHTIEVYIDECDIKKQVKRRKIVEEAIDFLLKDCTRDPIMEKAFWNKFTWK